VVVERPNFAPASPFLGDRLELILQRSRAFARPLAIYWRGIGGKGMHGEGEGEARARSPFDFSARNQIARDLGWGGTGALTSGRASLSSRRWSEEALRPRPKAGPDRGAASPPRARRLAKRGEPGRRRRHRRQGFGFGQLLRRPLGARERAPLRATFRPPWPSGAVRRRQRGRRRARRRARGRDRRREEPSPRQAASERLGRSSTPQVPSGSSLSACSHCGHAGQGCVRS